MLLAILACSAPASAALDILPLDQVRSGMRGTGRTVFSGGRIEDFDVEIVDVVRSARSRGSLILFRGFGTVLEHTGIIAGMSGSPVYIDGKLVGAIAFAYPFVKDPIGAITPIEEMLELDRFPRPDAHGLDGIESGPAGDEGAPGGGEVGPGKRSAGVEGQSWEDPTAEARGAGNAGAFAALWFTFTRGAGVASTEVPAATFESESDGMQSVVSGAVAGGAQGGLRPLPVPLAFVGWEPALLDAARGPAGKAGFVATEAAGPTAAGSAAGIPSAGGPAILEPGSAMALEMVGGDATIAAIGTVTAVDGDHVYAFGHPMTQGGAVAFPMYGARIHSVMPSLEVSFKMGSPTTAMGAVRQDRRAGVLGLLGPLPSTIPVCIRISLPGGVDETFHYRVVRDPILSPMFLPWTVSNSYQRSGWSQGETTGRAEVEVHFDGGRIVRRSDLVTTDAPALGFGGTAIMPASLLLTNPFQRVRLDSLSVHVTAMPGREAAEVTRVRCTPRRAAFGDTVHVEITLRPWRGPTATRTSQFVVPPGWEGKRLRVTAAGTGEFLDWDRDRAPGKWSPRDLDDLLRMVETLPSAGSLLIRVSSRDPGALVQGREVPGLPGSLLLAGRESGGAASIQSAAGAVLEEKILETPWNINGREAAEVEVTR